MKRRLGRVCLLLEFAIAAASSVRAANLYVAPNGTASGPGTEAKPYDLISALSGSVGSPGGTFWLRGGVYKIGRVETQVHGAPGRPITFRQCPGERSQLVGSLNIWGKGGDVIFRDFELSSGETRRLSTEMNKGFRPTDVPDMIGIQSYAPNVSFINLVVHDSVRSGFYTSQEATNTLIYGCIVYNTGWASPDNAEGHGYYLQGSGEICDNLGFNSTGANFHVYASGADCHLRNLTMDGNVAFGAGTLQSVRPYRDWIIGVDAPAVGADNIVLKNNMGFLTGNPTTLAQVQIGRENVNGSLVLDSNYWPQGIVVKNWSNATVSGNVFAPQNSDYAVDLQENLTKLAAKWDNNCYAGPSKHRPFHFNSKECNFSEWKKATGYDSNSSCTGGRLQGTKVFVRPNRYEPGRANVVVYNWDRLSKVAIDVCSILRVGDAFEVRNAEDFFSPPVATGIFDGQALELPMSGLTVAKPNGPLKAPLPTGPTFNVFVLLSRTNQDIAVHARRQ